MPSSTKPQNGSSKASSSRTHSSNYTYTHHAATQSSQKQAVDRFVEEPRDVRSYAVREYDPYQQAERSRKQEDLSDVLRRDY
jgi:hypothetical protein